MILCSFPGPWPPPSARAALAPWRSPDTRSLVVFPMAAALVGGNLPRGMTPGGEHPRGRVRGAPAPPLRPGRESPPQGTAPGVPLRYPLGGRLRSENPLREPSLPHSPGPAHPHAAHLWRCAPGSRGYTHAGCSLYKMPNKVIEIETPPQASEPGFLLKWLQGPRRGTASASGPAHLASCSAPCAPAPPPPQPGSPASLATSTAAASVVGACAAPAWGGAEGGVLVRVGAGNCLPGA